MIRLLLSVGFIALSLRLFAAEAPPSLQDALQAALAQHPEASLSAAYHDEAAALEQAAQQWLADAPSLEGRVLSDRLSTDTGREEWEVGLTLPLRWSKQRTARAELAQRTAASGEEFSAAWQLRVAGLLRERVWALAFAHNQLSLAERELERARILEKQVQRRVELGELAHGDALLAQEERLRKARAVLEARSELHQAEQAYSALTGLQQAPENRLETLSEQTLVAETHPLLAQAQADLARDRAQLRLSRADAVGNPELSLSVQRDRGDQAAPYQTSLNLAVSIPLGGARYQGAERAAQQRALAQAQSAYAQLRRDLETQWREAQEALQRHQDGLEISSEQQRLAQENYRLSEKAFALGETDLVNLQRVQALAFAAERAAQQQQLALHRAIAFYNQAVGVLP